MAVEVAMSSAHYPAASQAAPHPSHRRTMSTSGMVVLGRTSSLPAPHPLIRIPSEEAVAGGSALSPIGSPNRGPGASHRTPRAAGAKPLQSQDAGPIPTRPCETPVTTEAGADTKLRLALDCASGRTLAVKSVSSTALPRESRQLEREQECLEKLRGCPHVVQLISVEESVAESGARTKSLLLEYVSGGSVADVMTRFGRGGGEKAGLPEAVVRRYARGVLQALNAVHARGLVHCDVKARNILVCGATGAAKLCSFGLSLRQGEASERLARKQRLQGTYQWMAPEVMRQEDQTSASDVWSLGCTLLEMLTACPPWAGQVEGGNSVMAEVIGRSQSLPNIPHSVSPDCQKFLRRCLVRDPAQRPSAQQLLQDPFVQSPSPPRGAATPGSNAPAVPVRSPVPGPSPAGKDRAAALALASSIPDVAARPKTKGYAAQPPGMSAVVFERPQSPDGHHGICKETLEQATMAKSYSAGSDVSVQIWRREEEEVGGGWQGAASEVSQQQQQQQHHHQQQQKLVFRQQSLPPQPSGQVSSLAPSPPMGSLQQQPTAAQAALGQAAPSPGMPAGLPASAAGKLVLPPSVPPALSQLLTSPNGIKMGPLMRQISRDAFEFARFQQSSSNESSPARRGVMGIPGLPPTPGGGAARGTDLPPRSEGGGVFSPVAPASPKSTSPLSSSPRTRAHRRTSSVQVEYTPSVHRRTGSVLDGAAGGGSGAAEQKPLTHRRSGSVCMESLSSTSEGNPFGTPSIPSNLRKSSS